MTNEEMVYYLKRADLTVGQKNKTKTAEAIEKALKIIATQPKRGHWEVIRKEYEFMGGIVNESQGCKCSNCGGIVKFKSDFCPNCGRRMDADIREVQDEGKHNYILS